MFCCREAERLSRGFCIMVCEGKREKRYVVCMSTRISKEETFMADPTSIAEIDWLPIQGKSYWNSVREWREEFIYFLLIDRFHDNRNRAPVLTSARIDRSDKISSPEMSEQV